MEILNLAPGSLQYFSAPFALALMLFLWCLLCLWCLWCSGPFAYVSRFVRTLQPLLPSLTADAAGLSGAAAVIWGAWRIYEPAGFIVGGVLLMAGTWLYSRQPTPPAE